jgi:dTDP-4-dehydrorhamnose 3,5-epimerase
LRPPRVKSCPPHSEMVLFESMLISEYDIAGLKLITPRRIGDERGYFQEVWSDRLFREMVADVAFVQDNQSMSARKGTVRGLHYQSAPFAQGKLVRVLRGSILDVVVDVRQGSSTFGRHVAIRMDAISGTLLWVPTGFLHGFCTLEDHTEVFYKITNYYSASHDAGVIWNDPDIGINWPVDACSAILSEKDKRLPYLRDLAKASFS